MTSHRKSLLQLYPRTLLWRRRRSTAECDPQENFYGNPCKHITFQNDTEPSTWASGGRPLCGIRTRGTARGVGSGWRPGGRWGPRQGYPAGASGVTTPCPWLRWGWGTAGILEPNPQVGHPHVSPRGVFGPQSFSSSTRAQEGCMEVICVTPEGVQHLPGVN